MAELPAFVQALLTAQPYPHRPHQVELVQTQMSFLFLTGDYVYKVKKPVNLGYLDYTTLEQRRHFCHQEVALNRRLCPEVYLGVVGITQERGIFFIEREGDPIEYAVKMRQLPRERMMDHLLRTGKVTAKMVGEVAPKLARFHREAETSPEISQYGAVANIKVNTDENFSQTEGYIGLSITAERYKRLRSYTNAFLEQKTPLLERRAREGRVRDCHGDVHSAHVCFSDSIVIYDCIEFNDRFRYGDVASEVAFLAMDIDYHGRPDLSREFVEAYLEASSDGELREVLDFYKCYRAYVRGKVEGFKLDDPLIPNKEQVLKVAAKYFELAHLYAHPRKPTLIITTGLIGTGKSALAEALSQRVPLAVISSDIVRKKLANILPEERRFESFDTGIYSEAFSARTYDEIFRQAKRIMEAGQSVIIDASFRKSKERERARKLAAEARADFKVVECVAGEEVIKERLSHRFERESVSDGRLEILPQFKEDFEPLTEVPQEAHLIADTSKSVAELEETEAKLLKTLGL